MTVLVTGGAGFIGSHFIERLLARDAEKIVCLDDFNDDYDRALKRANVAPWAADPRVTLIEQSFCDAAAMRRLLAAHGVRRIVHLGARTGVRASIANPLAYEETNVGGTLALLQAARACPVERFLLVSSSTVYGAGAAVPFREDAPLGVPLSPYGASKRAAELLGLSYHAEHRVPVVCVRPFSVYGPRIRPDLAMGVFAESIEKSRPLPLYGDGSVRRDFTHVNDICDGLFAALVADGVLGETINLGHQEPVAIRDLLAMLESALGRKAVIDQQPSCAADMPVTCADLTKAQRLLDYRPRVALADGVRDFVAWFRRRGSTST
jgi:UDP-glucuronate 4-epimerase